VKQVVLEKEKSIGSQMDSCSIDHIRDVEHFEGPLQRENSFDLLDIHSKAIKGKKSNKSMLIGTESFGDKSVLNSKQMSEQINAAIKQRILKEAKTAVATIIRCLRQLKNQRE